jgi:hypothetical protein
VDRYELPDPTLRACDHGVGELRVDGELRGYLASVVGEIKFPRRSPWLWFVRVWLDGSRERAEEDYGPGWYIVRELDAGYFDDFEASVPMERRGWFGRRVRYRKLGAACRYDFAWLPPAEAAAKWTELGLEDSDF